MFEIMMLSGQEYVDEYAAKHKKPPPGANQERPPSAGAEPPLRAVS
jgi:hypothetical protein